MSIIKDCQLCMRVVWIFNLSGILGNVYVLLSLAMKVQVLDLGMLHLTT